jgi:CheY-like chemotaxis protein
MKQHRILVVEDDPNANWQFTTALAGQGYDVVAVRDGQEALVFLAAYPPPPDLILLDLVMPVLDGWQFLDLRPHPQVPVIVATSTDPPEPEGCAGFLHKPFETAELLAEVRRCLG